MESTKLKIDILPNLFLKDDGTFDLDSALILAGKYAGVCYDKEGFNHLVNEPLEKTQRRIDMTKNNGHHSVYDHISISFNLQNVPKILAMVLNNEKEYTTSEKSARYTKIEKGSNVITDREIVLYNKWIEIFKTCIKDRYGRIYNDSKIQKLAQENARYLITVFMPTQMIYTTSLRQINYIASWMQEYIKYAGFGLSKELATYMKDFIDELDRLKVLDVGLMKNEKQRHFSLFGTNLSTKRSYYDTVYSTTYKGSFASLAQAQRHRSLNYEMQRLNEKEYFVPPIIDYSYLRNEWLEDIKSVGDRIPQGELVLIHESGTYDNFVLKCKERLCTAAQLEIMLQTKETLENYRMMCRSKAIQDDVRSRSHGARCTFNDYECSEHCNFDEGIKLTRLI